MLRHVGPLPALFLGLVASATADDAADRDFFEAKVRPVLAARCLECHGPEKPKGGLRLDSRAAVLAGGESGPAAVAGRPDDSLLVQATRYVDEPRMPPKGKLPDDEAAALSRWVAIGLPWPAAPATATATVSAKGTGMVVTEAHKQFWSFRPPRDHAPPAVKAAAWPTSDVDHFLLARLEAAGLAPAPPADRRTLIRRATFDLAGLPPTPIEVDAFLADGSADAFAKVVDRLLASPAYGERWGRHWLDVVRYADARDARGVGGTEDITEAWRYRDWVVSAFNRDLPYDRFVIDQVAGDLIPAESPGDVNAEGLIATGLLAIGEWGTGDADKEKMMTDLVADQVDVVTRGFLGLTVACARCHDHKFDPIPTADYYGLAGIFHSTRILPDPGVKTRGSDLLRTPLATKAAVAEAEAHKAKLAGAQAELKRIAAEARAAFTREALSHASRYMVAALDASAGPAGAGPIAADRALDPRVLRRWMALLGTADGGELLSKPVASLLGKAGVQVWSADAPDGLPWVGVNSNAEPARLLTFVLPPRSLNVHPAPKTSAAIRWRSPVSGVVTVSGRVSDADGVCGDGAAFSVVVRRGSSSRVLAGGDFPNGGGAPIEGAALASIAVEPGDEIALGIAPRGDHACDSTTVRFRVAGVDPGLGTWDAAEDLVPDLLAGNPHADRSGHPGVWSFAGVDSPAPRPARSDPAWADWDRAAASGDRAAASAAAEALQARIDSGEPAPFVAALSAPKGPFSPGDEEAIASLPPGRLRDEATRARADRESLSSAVPKMPMALAAQDGGVPKSVHEGFHDARIHVRGDYRRLGEVVPRHFPVVAGGDSAPALNGSGRLELARWIASADNPLTARVMVNRIWQHHFGAGLVRTPSNFGALGEPPSHPELLDSLARRFVASGWSVKALHRTLMLSAAYAQSSRASHDAMRLDPENRLVGRMPRRRLEAEELRDALLAVSGRLDPSLGGPSIRDLSTARRTLYVMTIRSDRSSFGPLFDAADAAAMVDARTVSTVATQSLFLLNAPFVLTQSGLLADRVRAEEVEDGARIDRLYALLFGRMPRDEERMIGRSLVDRAKAAGAEERRTWAEYAQVLVCTNEFVFID